MGLPTREDRDLPGWLIEAARDDATAAAFVSGYCRGSMALSDFMEALARHLLAEKRAALKLASDAIQRHGLPTVIITPTGEST